MVIKLSASNISWGQEQDQVIYKFMRDIGFSGLEIAPTRLFGSEPYSMISGASDYAKWLLSTYDLSICSLQSIWYGRNEKIFASKEQRNQLLQYTKSAVLFAEKIGAGNLVFGCPKHRCINSDRDREIAIDFFSELGEFAYIHHTVLAFEANPVIYGTNYINNTSEAVELVKKVESPGFKLNLDCGTIIYNKEGIDSLLDVCDIINHVHISEPNLNLIRPRKLHKDLIGILKKNSYKGYVSIEMGKQNIISDIYNTMLYVKEICEEK